MVITWFGHSCFLMETSKGQKILTDPFPPALGYDLYSGPIDYTTISHYHFDHGYTKALPTDCKIIDSVGSFEFEDLKIIGLPSYHDCLKGSIRGTNIIFIFEIDGFRLCHLGDLGYILSADEIDLIGSIDVLFIPIGGNFTLGAREAFLLCKKINPKIIMPMHYKTSKISYPISGVDLFLNLIKKGEKLSSNTITINHPIIVQNKVMILNYM